MGGFRLRRNGPFQELELGLRLYCCRQVVSRRSRPPSRNELPAEQIERIDVGVLASLHFDYLDFDQFGDCAPLARFRFPGGLHEPAQGITPPAERAWCWPFLRPFPPAVGSIPPRVFPPAGANAGGWHYPLDGCELRFRSVGC